MSGQLENSHDPPDPEDLDEPPDGIEGLRVGVGLDEEHGDEVGHDGEHVDHVHRALNEGTLLRSTCIRRWGKLNNY